MRPYKMKFGEKVWELLREIPEGKVSTYKMIAEKMGCNAYRAVGNACRRNPNPPIIPCHRVVNSDGRIGGFGGETSGAKIEKKITLLKKEGIGVRNGKIVNFDQVLYKFKPR